MKKVVQVRNIRIGEGMPKICVSIIETTKEGIIKEANHLKDQPVDVIEWRADWYLDVNDIQKVKEVALELRKELEDKPILFTFRTKKEGGEKDISSSDYEILNKEVAATGAIDLMDVELFMGDNLVKDIIEYAHNKNIKVIVSNHDFNKTPLKDELIKRLKMMQKLGADLPKIAVMPNNKKDVLELLLATDEMVEQYATGPIITMSMASSGMVSRITGEFFGSALTFAAAKKASAPGQIAVNDLQTVLNIIHENLSHS